MEGVKQRCHVKSREIGKAGVGVCEREGSGLTQMR